MNIKIIFLILFNFIHIINSDDNVNLSNNSDITNSSSSNSISISNSDNNNNSSNNSFVNIFPDELTTLNFEQQTKEDTLDAVSFGIKSFTIEVTTSSEKLSPRSSPSTLLQQVSTKNDVITTTSSTENPSHGTTVDDVIIKWPTTTSSPTRDTNGLYRVKIAEITTDEFDNHLLYNNDIIADDEDDIKLRQKLKLKKQENHKFNIIDFYPSKIDDFPGVVIKQVTSETKETTTPDLIPDIKIPTSNIEIELIEDNNGNIINLNKTVTTGGSYSNDFASELQEDDTIKKIEESFYPKAVNYRSIFTRPVSGSTTSTTTTPTTATTTTVKSQLTKRPQPPRKYEFIERRIKKNDPQLKFKLKNNEGVANTKFTSDGKDKIEFSTTKFYSNNEQPPLQSAVYNKIKMSTEKEQTHASTTIASISPSITTITTEMSPTTTTTTIMSPHTKLRLEKIIKISKTIRNGSEKFKLRKQQQITTNVSSPPPPHKEQYNTMTTIRSVPPTTNSANPMSTTTRFNEIIETTKTTTSTTIPPTIKSKTKMTTPNGLVKFPLTIQKSIPRQFINNGSGGVIGGNNGGITRLEEKVNSLDCELNNILPIDSTLWRGNETHELNLPITQPENCSFGVDCLPMIISWEGTIEIQSGDVLLVVIDDKLLQPSNSQNVSKTIEQNFHKTTTTVYQVTRMGHEHCDITEGVLLDITPLVVDGKKLVTLYDKDLTEGINLLIVVSELWKQQCVRLRVTVKSDNCGENAECSGKGVCFSNSSMEGYECQCCNGFAGSHCEEIDACTPSPCTNNGICVDLSQGHEGNSYQCLCPYGYTGKNCQYESEPCNPSQCLNSGTCIGNLTNFRCECAPGFKGPLCQHNLNECLSSPCFHGICVDQEDGFRCVCQSGYSGDLCNFELNECESNPCLNGGQCNDHIGSYSCKCTKGYNGKRCHIKVDFCANDPCPEGHRCVDRGDDFTCECPGGRNGPDCNQVPRTLCNINPCANGGTCWTSEESFYCACRPGFTGKMCEDDFVVETIVGSNEIVNDESSIHTFGESSSFGSGSKRGPIELHNAYIAAGTLTAAIFIVAVIVTACHCKVNQTYRRFITRHHPLIPIPGFSFRKSSSNNHKHWLSGKGLQLNKKHLPATNHNLQPNQLNTGHLPSQTTSSGYLSSQQPANTNSIGYPVRTLNRTLPLNLENDMYYTVDFSDSQNAPLIQ